MDPIRLAEEAEKEGIPLNVVKEWYSKFGNDPAVRGKTEAEVIQGMKYAANKYRDLMPTQQVTVTGKRPPIPTVVQPWAGSSQEAAAGDEGNPSASSLSQFDPARRAAVEAEFQRRWKEGQTGRDIQNILAGAVSGFSGGQVLRDAREQQNSQYTKLKDFTIDAAKRAEETAAAGLDAVRNESQRLRDEGQFQGTQREQQMKLESMGFNLDAQRRLNAPDSPETLATKAMIPQLLQQPGVNPQVAAELRALASKPGVTAAQLEPVISKLSPAAMDMWLKTVQGRKTQADTGLVGQETRKVGAEADIASVLADAVKSGKMNLTDALRYATLSAGGVTVPPNPVDVKLAGTEAEMLGESARRAKVFDNEMAPTIRRIRNTMNKVEPGKLTDVVGKWLPGNDQQELINLLNAANNTYGGILPEGVDAKTAQSIQQGGFNGALVASMTKPQVDRMLELIEEKSRLDRQGARETLQRPAGSKPGVGPVEKPMASTRPSALPLRNSKGWELKVDAQGNKAYVSPDGKQFEEVKE